MAPPVKTDVDKKLLVSSFLFLVTLRKLIFSLAFDTISNKVISTPVMVFELNQKQETRNKKQKRSPNGDLNDILTIATLRKGYTHN